MMKNTIILFLIFSTICTPLMSAGFPWKIPQFDKCEIVIGRETIDLAAKGESVDRALKVIESIAGNVEYVEKVKSALKEGKLKFLTRDEVIEIARNNRQNTSIIDRSFALFIPKNYLKGINVDTILHDLDEVPLGLSVLGLLHEGKHFFDTNELDIEQKLTQRMEDIKNGKITDQEKEELKSFEDKYILSYDDILMYLRVAFFEYRAFQYEIASRKEMFKNAPCFQAMREKFLKVNKESEIDINTEAGFRRFSERYGSLSIFKEAIEYAANKEGIYLGFVIPNWEE